MKKYYLILVFVCVVLTVFVCSNTMAKDKSDTIVEALKALKDCYAYVKERLKDKSDDFDASYYCIWATEKINKLKIMDLSQGEHNALIVLDKDFKKYIKERWGKYPPVAVKLNLSFTVLNSDGDAQEFKEKSVNTGGDSCNFIPGGPVNWFKPTNINNENVDDFIYEINKAYKIRQNLHLLLPDDISQKMFTKLIKGINVSYLDFGYAQLVKDISALKNSTNLKKLRLFVNKGIKGAEVLGTLPEFEMLELESNNHFLKSLAFLGKIPSLKILKISRSNIKSLIGLKNLPNLEELVITETEIEEDLSPIANARKLKKFKLIFNVYPHEGKDITPLGSLSELKELFLRIDINDITPLAKLQNLEKLFLSISENTDLSPISKLRKLRAICPPYWIKNLRFLEKSSNLEYLYLAGSQVEDISSIAKLKKLKKLNLWYCDKIRDYSPIGDVQNLQVLYLTALNIKSLDFLVKLKKLQNLHMLGNKTIKDFTPLTKLTHLKELVIDAFEYLDDSNKKMLVKSLPKCSIEFGGICFCVEGVRYLSFE